MLDIIKQNSKNSKGIKINKSSYNRRIIISNGGVKIRREGKPISDNIVWNGIVYLLIDCSVSMNGQNLTQAKNGAVNFAKEAKSKNYSIGLIQFADTAIHICEPQQEISNLSRHLETMHAEGYTNMAEALSLSFEKLKSKIGNRVVVLVTDGEPTAGEPTPEEATLKEAYKIKKNGIDIITIGTDDADREFLKKIATRTDLVIMVSKKKLEKGITSTAEMLPMLSNGK